MPGNTVQYIFLRTARCAATAQNRTFSLAFPAHARVSAGANTAHLKAISLAKEVPAGILSGRQEAKKNDIVSLWNGKMSLVKWFRKNLKKLMAIVVVLLMFAFLMPDFLRQLQQGGGRLAEPVAFFGQNGRITARDLAFAASSELNILRASGAEDFLRSQQDLRAYLLAELLFSEPAQAARFSRQLKENLSASRLRISAAQIDSFFEQCTRRGPTVELCWLLLKAETAQAGVVVPAEEAKRVLSMIIPALTGGFGYGQVMSSLVARLGAPEEKILRVFADLLAVHLYADAVSSVENVTTGELMHQVRDQQEGLDAEFVRFDASVFVDEQTTLRPEQLTEHFEKYKGFFAGQVSQDNPFGFGYKLPELVQLEYMLLKLQDVGELAGSPTEEEKEQYYQANIKQFTGYVLADPNNPDSEKLPRVKSYAEVAGGIARQLQQEKVGAKAETMLNEAKRITESALEGLDAEQLDAQKLRQLAGDYPAAAAKVSDKYKVKIYTGTTGLLSAEDFMGDRQLGRLFVTGQGQMRIRLGQAVFAGEALGPEAAGRLGPFALPRPKLYENLGPVKDSLGELLVLARIVDAQKATEPSSLQQTFSKETLQLDQEPPGKPPTYLLTEAAARDVRLLQAMDRTRQQAEEFVELAQSGSWDQATEQFNQRHTGGDPNNPGPRPFRVQRWQGTRRISNEDMQLYKLHTAADPRARTLVANRWLDKERIELIYSLLGGGKNSPENLPLVVEHKPERCYYAIKSLSRQFVSREQYEKSKAQAAFTQDSITAQSLGFVHLNPQNILKRMNYRPAGKATYLPAPEEPGVAPVEEY